MRAVCLSGSGRVLTATHNAYWPSSLIAVPVGEFVVIFTGPSHNTCNHDYATDGYGANDGQGNSCPEKSLIIIHARSLFGRLCIAPSGDRRMTLGQGRS